MPLDWLTVENVSGERGHSETTPPPKYKIGNMKRKCEEEEEKEGKTEAAKRVRRGGEVIPSAHLLALVHQVFKALKDLEL